MLRPYTTHPQNSTVRRTSQRAISYPHDQPPRAPRPRRGCPGHHAWPHSPARSADPRHRDIPAYAGDRGVTDRATRQIGYQLSDWLQPATGYRLAVSGAAGTAARTISLRVDPALSQLGEEGYRLTVMGTRITIRAFRPAGVFYGVETLRQLLPPDVFRAAPVSGASWTVPAVNIEDMPRFQWRGAHLDVSRSFMPKEFVKKYIDLLALHKLNRFHWHLTDDRVGASRSRSIRCSPRSVPGAASRSPAC